MKGFGGMDRIGNNLRRVQANQGNPLTPSVYARYATFLPATQHFCPLRNIFARYATFLPVFPIFGPKSLFYRRFARFLRQICGWTTPVGLPCCYDNSCHHQSIPPRGGGHSPGFINPTVLSHTRKSVGALSRADRLN